MVTMSDIVCIYYNVTAMYVVYHMIVSIIIVYKGYLLHFILIIIMFLSIFCTGIGWGMVTISAMVCIYYNVIIMYAIYYMFVSFVNLDGDVPWIDCGNPWNTKYCRQEAYPDFDSMTNDSAKIYELSSKFSKYYFSISCSPYTWRPSWSSG